jgi:hypothetical protein
MTLNYHLKFTRWLCVSLDFHGGKTGGNVNLACAPETLEVSGFIAEIFERKRCNT